MPGAASDLDALGDAIGNAVRQSISDAHADNVAHHYTHSYTDCGTCHALAISQPDSYPIADTAPDSAAERY